jgi:branched-chain amino acid transport system ATP-binding protein
MVEVSEASQFSSSLSVRDLSVSYGKLRALQDVSFDLSPGEILGVLGANGAGKSTLLKAISGLVRPTTGSISFGGQSLLGLSGERIPELGIAHVPERRRVFASMTVYENLFLGAYVLRSKKNSIEAPLKEVYELFPRLEERSRQLAGSLSGGEQQMVAVGRALMSRPRLLMLDEPSLGLAPVVVEQMFDRIRQIHDEMHISIILVEQNAALALDLVDRGIVLDTGTVNFEGVAEDLKGSPYLRQAYLGI